MIGAMIWEMMAGDHANGVRTEAEAAQLHAGRAPGHDVAAGSSVDEDPTALDGAPVAQGGAQ